MIIETTFDTSSKSLIVKADGKKIKDIADVAFVSFGSDGEFFMEITTLDLSKLEDGVLSRTHIIASIEGGVEIVETDSSFHEADPPAFNHRFQRPMTKIEQVQLSFDLNKRNKVVADLSKAFR